MEFVILHATATSDRAHNLNGHFRKELKIIIFPTGLSLACMLIGLHVRCISISISISILECTRAGALGNKPNEALL